MEVIFYNRTFNKGMAIGKNKWGQQRVFHISKKDIIHDNPNKYLVKGEFVKGDELFLNDGTRTLINVKPFHDYFYFETHKEIKFCCF